MPSPTTRGCGLGVVFQQPARLLSIEQALTLRTRASFDLVLVGHLYTTNEQHAIVDKAHDVKTNVLCIYAESSSPDVPADAFVRCNDTADHLLTLTSNAAVFVDNGAMLYRSLRRRIPAACRYRRSLFRQKRLRMGDIHSRLRTKLILLGSGSP